MYSITKEQILEFVEWGNNADAKKVREEWFPEVFETKLEVGKWYKSLSEYGSLFEYLGKSKARGFFQGDQWTDEWEWIKSIKIRESTEQEVKTALENEAIKRGFGKIGIVFNSLNNDECISDIEGFDFWNLKKYQDSEDSNKFNISVCESGGVIFRQGIWATIIPTLTKKEAEEKLGVKII